MTTGTSASRQTGFALVEVSLALLILTMVATAGLTRMFDEFNDDRAKAQGEALKTVQTALGAYLARNTLAIIGNSPNSIPYLVGNGSVANARNPTIADLVGTGSLPSGFNSQALIGGNYVLRITVPAGCTVAALADLNTNCDLDGLAYINTPYTSPPGVPGARVDGGRLGMALNVIGANGGFSSPQQGAVISGYGAQWSVANPLGNTPGILAARALYGTSSMAQFLRRDGSLPMVGNLNISPNANSPTGTGFNATLDTTGNIKLAGTLTTGGSVTASGNVTAGGNVTATGNITASGNVSAGTYLLASTGGTAQRRARGSACTAAEAGQMRTNSDGGGTVLSCQLVTVNGASSWQWQLVGSSEVTDSGTNYIKYTDGTMLQWGKATTVGTVTLPQQFINNAYSVSATLSAASCTPYIFDTAYLTNSSSSSTVVDCAPTVSGQTATGFTTSNSRHTSTGWATMPYDWIATGRWK